MYSSHSKTASVVARTLLRKRTRLLGPPGAHRRTRALLCLQCAADKAAQRSPQRFRNPSTTPKLPFIIKIDALRSCLGRSLTASASSITFKIHPDLSPMRQRFCLPNGGGLGLPLSLTDRPHLQVPHHHERDRIHIDQYLLYPVPCCAPRVRCAWAPS